MNQELLEALRLLEKERGIEAEMLFGAIEEALVSAYKREFDAKTTDNIRAEVDRETGEMRVFLAKEIVAEVEDPNTDMSLADAKALSEDFELGDVLEYQISPQDFGRLAAQTAKSVINQRLSQAEKERIQNEFSSRIGDLAYGVVQRRDRREVIVDIGRAEAVLMRNEQSRLDRYEFNQKMRFYILKVDERRGRPIVCVSRSHPNLVRKLFEQEVPEISSGVVEIMSISREAGSRTKIAVYSHDPNIDAVGSCVGQRGMRVQNVIEELNGEKIDIIDWDADPVAFITNALRPARVLRVKLFDPEMNDGQQIAQVIVPDSQLSLAIGREGQNARLAARLTNWKIDIKSESQYREILEEELLAQFDTHLDGADFEDELSDEPEDMNETLAEDSASEDQPVDFAAAVEAELAAEEGAAEFAPESLEVKAEEAELKDSEAVSTESLDALEEGR
ncbi:MAG: transcription termination factor NusA [Eubacteriales bacterium]|nr:transcription termination factor NusA [Eubacteriales bacterium]